MREVLFTEHLSFCSEEGNQATLKAAFDFTRAYNEKFKSA